MINGAPKSPNHAVVTFLCLKPRRLILSLPKQSNPANRKKFVQLP